MNTGERRPPLDRRWPRFRRARDAPERSGTGSSPAWTGRSRGTALGYAIFDAAMRLFGRRGAYALLWLVVPFYVVVAGPARRGSKAYLRRVLGDRGWWRRQTDTFKHFMTFGRSIVDAAMIARGDETSFTLEHEHIEYIHETAAKGRGLILLSAHVGSRALASELLDVPLNIVAYDNEARAVRRFYERTRRRKAPRVIVANDGLSASTQILAALDAGEAVAMLADRVRMGRSIRHPFLGEPADFPVGPFLIAVLSGAPVVAAFGMKEGARHHHFYAEPPRTLGPVPRDQRETAITEGVSWYVTLLEAFVRRCPYQWYNLYDFWRPRG